MSAYAIYNARSIGGIIFVYCLEFVSLWGGPLLEVSLKLLILFSNLRSHLLPDGKEVWNFLKKFVNTEYYNKKPAQFVLDLLRLQMPELLKSSVNTLAVTDLESEVRQLIRGDDRTSRRILLLVDTLLVRAHFLATF